MGRDMAERIAGLIEELPTLPAVAQKALGLLTDPGTEPEELDAVLGRDPALALKVFRLANSAYYRRRRDVRTLAEAIVLLGFKTVYTLVLSSAVHRVLAAAPGVAEPLWLHCYGAGVACREWARQVRVPPGQDPDEAFLSGLFHDVAKGVIAVWFPGLYDEPVGTGGEHEALGFHHPHLGRVLLERWEIPRPLGDAVGDHHAPGAEGLALTVRIADWVVWPVAPGVGAAPPGRPGALDGLGVGEDQVEAVREAVAACLAEEGA